MDKVDRLRQRVIAEVDARRDELTHISDTIHANPELAFAEFKSAALLSGVLEANGFSVKRGVADLETAFVAALRGLADRPTVAFLAEYDALPGLGHACGHNLIGTAAVGAGLAMRTVLSELAGSIQIVGTPAEEKGGGKVLMVQAGVFSAVDAAMMVHPHNRNGVDYRGLAFREIRIEYHGKAAHATTQPEAGINALNAMLLTFNGMNAMRPHLREDARVYGIITHGGTAANIVPDYAAGVFHVRAIDSPYRDEMLEKLRGCAEGAARATGARLEFTLPLPGYDPMMSNPRLCALARDNMTALGLAVTPAKTRGGVGSSDMGNVSQVVPALHAYIAIGSREKGAPHSVEFCKAAASPVGHEALVNAAKVMALTAVDLLVEPANLAEIKRAFDAKDGI